MARRELFIKDGVFGPRLLPFKEAALIAENLAGEDELALVHAVKVNIFGACRPSLVRLAALLGKMKGVVLRSAQIEAAELLVLGRAVQMGTGEGKTYSIALAAAYLALRGGAVHVVTPSRYLADRDARDLGPFYLSLGLPCVSLNPLVRISGYNESIIYGQMAEFAFDYLRDTVSLSPPRQSRNDYLIVDEIDSQLLDQGTTPLVISGKARPVFKDILLHAAEVVEEACSDNCDQFFTVVGNGDDVEITEAGYARVERNLVLRGRIEAESDLYQAPLIWMRAIINAVRAKLIFEEGKDYLLRNGSVVVIDGVNHRASSGKKWNQGIHQAIEAKHGVAISGESQAVATTTVQGFVSRYRGLSGVSGTALMAREPLGHLYGLASASVAPSFPALRRDHGWTWIGEREERELVIVGLAADKAESGQAVLICADSVSSAERVYAKVAEMVPSAMLLTADNEADESKIVSLAGKGGTITVSTPMAGRGTDFCLDHLGRSAGGLCVIQVDPLLSQRLDEQVKGRAARNGDPGEWFGFVGEDSRIIRNFGDSGIRAFFRLIGVTSTDRVSHRRVDASVFSAQEKSERSLADARNHLLRVANVVEEQKRHFLLIRNSLINAGKDELTKFYLWLLLMDLESYCPAAEDPRLWRLKPFLLQLDVYWGIRIEIPQAPTKESIQNALVLALHETMRKSGVKALGCRLLAGLDASWQGHVGVVESIQAGMGLKAYAGLNPFIEYKTEAAKAFSDFLSGEVRRAGKSALLSGIKK